MASHIFCSRYVISEVYKDLIGSNPNCDWSRVIWRRTTISKHKFIFWLVMLNKLKTRANLKKAYVIDEDICPICLMNVDSFVGIEFTFPV